VHRFLTRRPVSPVGPITASIVAEQQRVADAFHRLQLIPRALRVADAVWRPGTAHIAQSPR
jgi:sulfonate transport system substrate-binding protein